MTAKKCDKCWGTGEAIDQRELGRLMRALRTARGRTLKAEAKRIGISESYLCLLEKGRKRWSEKLYLKLKDDGAVH